MLLRLILGTNHERVRWYGLGGKTWFCFRVRYRLSDGELTSETGFATRDAASERVLDIEVEQRVGVFTDARLGQTLVCEWVTRWADAHDVGRGTWAK